jgi:outer membrane protein TolC
MARARLMAFAFVCLFAMIPLRGEGGDLLTLPEAVELTLAHSPALTAAAFDDAAASLRRRGARASYLPVLSAESGYGRAYGYDEAVTNGGDTHAIVKLETTLFDGKAGIARGAEAKAKLLGARSDERSRRAEVAFAATEAYLGILSARRERELQVEVATELESYASLVDRLELGGGAPPGSALRARVALEGPKTALRSADADLSALAATLSILTGRSVTALDVVDPGEMGPPQITAEKIDASPSVATARATFDAAEAQVEALEAERWGKITFSADAGALGVRPEETFRDDRGGEFAFGGRVPLFDVAARTELAAKRAEASSARARLADARQRAAIEMTQLQASAAKARSDLEAARLAKPLADQSFLVLRARSLGGGDVRAIEVIDAVTQRTEAHLRIVRAELAYRLALAAQARSLGETFP